MDDQDTFLDLPFDDSSIFSYISNLSPIKPFKGAPVAQGFPGLNSPLDVFKSPQIDPPRLSSLLKRPQYPGLSSDELHRQDDDKGNAQLSSELNACSNNKGHGNIGGPAHDKSGIDFEGVDDYFLDFVEVGCVDSGNLTNFGLKQCDDAPPSLKESIEPKKNDITKSLSNLKPLGTDVKNGGRVMPISSSAHHTYEGQQNELLEAENAGGVHQVELNYTSQLLQESREPVHEYDDCSETTGGFSIEQSMMLHDSKVTQQQYGMRRQCLQFEETQQNIMANSPGPQNQINAARNSRSHANHVIPVYPEVLESSCADIPAPPSSRLLEKMKKGTFSMCPAQNFGHPNLKVSKPSGIGLNLNCIVNKMSMGSGGSASGSSKSYGMPMGIGITGCQLTENARNSSISSNVAQTLSVRSEENKHKSHANPMLSKKPTEHPATPFDKMKSISDHADSVEELNRSGPRKKRKKTSGSNDGNGCKNCNCKKTKCLKLYCDCFASGNYCDEHCSCQDCYNIPEFEETVIETRKQIESRNPFAFAPKIVSDVLELPAKTNQVLNAVDQIMMDPNNSLQKDIQNSTHSSARHKQGCNCKKSMCLKKYCECYQSNVGCSDGCRCEGCKNVYGKKEEYSTKDNVTVEGTNESSEISLNGKLDLMATTNGFLQNELCNSHNSTPLTPSFLLSDHGKEAIKSRFPSGMYTPSPKSDLTFSAPHGNLPGYPRSSDNPNMIQDTSKEIMGVVSFGEELYYANSAGVDGGFRDMNNITILQNTPSMSMAPLRNLSSAQLCPGNGGPFPSASSLQWHSSPITRFIDSDKGFYDVMEHDDTPEILKENPIPNIGVKVSSPNKKRVSPPHSRFRDLGSSSSVSAVGARSGMKFILDAGPSFPPLAPRIDPNGTTIQGANDHLDRSNS